MTETNCWIWLHQSNKQMMAGVSKTAVCQGNVLVINFQIEVGEMEALEKYICEGLLLLLVKKLYKDGLKTNGIQVY